MNFELPKLPYQYNELAPFIDALTVEIHYDRHHRAYANNLNNALAKYPEFVNGKTVEEILADVNSIPADVRQLVINNGGGFVNHNLYWSILTPNGGGKPNGALLEAINKTFGSFESFKEQVDNAAKTVFGSGWAFVVVNKEGGLEVVKSANQNSPISDGKKPILGIDVWEHAYYLNYQNKRPDYIAAIWNILNWKEITRLFEEATK
ncbi:MAG: superoxide dismutase [Haloplasmataceae bacterium]|jgi:Fe-Mn family superoxide dismutase|nr:superoxide dismutase [Haloplasmataceae bacterium]